MTDIVPWLRLNHWLFHNQMVNPPISFVTNGANPPMYDPSVVPLSASGMPMQMGIPTDGGITGWMNPAGASEPGMMPGQPVDMGMGHSVPQIGLGMNMPGHEGDGSMNISWDDGNNVQFWNKMIDGTYIRPHFKGLVWLMDLQGSKLPREDRTR